MVRTVKKVQTDIKETNEALDIDIVGATSTVVSAATEIAIGSSNSKIKGVGKFVNLIKKKKDKSETLEITGDQGEDVNEN